MIQVDYLYFYYPSSGIEDVRKQGPIEEVDATTGKGDGPVDSVLTYGRTQVVSSRQSFPRGCGQGVATPK